MVQAIVRELQERKDYFQDKTVETIYLGGGTPSLLSDNELSLILDTVFQIYPVEAQAEITLECNPEDLDYAKLAFLKSKGINRLSIGIQTFDNTILKYLNRVHDSVQAVNAVKLAQSLGIENITIDLMYALPYSSLNILQNDLETVVSLSVPHISAYCFTLEEKTAFGKMVKQNKLLKNEDSVEQAHYELLHNHLKMNGYEQYEISNYAREGHYSKHNSAYWFGKHYLGIGPGAHSFNGVQRQWNISNNPIYIQKILQGKNVYETETLSFTDKFNEGILTQLRTKWGVDAELLNAVSKTDLFKIKHNEILKLKFSGLITQTETHLYLTEKGKLLADGIVAELMV